MSETATPPAPAPAATAPAAAPVVPATPTPAPSSPTAMPADGPASSASFISQEGKFDWSQASSALPQELHGHIDGFEARFKDKGPADVLQSFVELETEFTQSKQKNAVPEEATLEAYGITKPEGMADDAWKSASGDLEPFLAKAKEVGLGKEGFQQMYGEFVALEMGREKAQEEAKVAARGEAEKTLQELWKGEYASKGETALNHITNKFNELNIPLDHPDAKALLDNPFYVMTMHDAATSMGEDSTVAGEGVTANPMSNAEKGLDIMNNPDNPLHQKFKDESGRGGGPTIDYVQSLRSKMVRPRQ